MFKKLWDFLFVDEGGLLPPRWCYLVVAAAGVGLLFIMVADAKEQEKVREAAAKSGVIGWPTTITYAIPFPEEARFREVLNSDDPRLAEVARLVKNGWDLIVSVEGYACQDGQDEDCCDRLAKDRANAVVSCLVSQYGVSGAAFPAITWGKLARPYSPGKKTPNQVVITIRPSG